MENQRDKKILSVKHRFETRAEKHHQSLVRFNVGDWVIINNYIENFYDRRAKTFSFRLGRDTNSVFRIQHRENQSYYVPDVETRLVSKVVYWLVLPMNFIATIFAGTNDMLAHYEREFPHRDSPFVADPAELVRINISRHKKREVLQKIRQMWEDQPFIKAQKLKCSIEEVLKDPETQKWIRRFSSTTPPALTVGAETTSPFTTTTLGASAATPIDPSMRAYQQEYDAPLSRLEPTDEEVAQSMLRGIFPNQVVGSNQPTIRTQPAPRRRTLRVEPASQIWSTTWSETGQTDSTDSSTQE